MKKHSIIACAGILFAAMNLSSQTQTFYPNKMILRFNGHDYRVQNLLVDSLAKAYKELRASMKDQIEEAVAKAGGKQPDIQLPDDITRIEFPDNGCIIRINGIIVNFDLAECRVDTKSDISISTSLTIVRDKLSYKLRLSDCAFDGTVKRIDVGSTHPWYQFWYGLVCQYVDVLANWIFLDTYKRKLQEMEFDLFGPGHLQTQADSLLQTESLDSFPMNFTFSEGIVDTGAIRNALLMFEGPRAGLVLGINFMTGRVPGDNSFVGIQPSIGFNSSFDYIGFSSQAYQIRSLLTDWYKSNPSARPCGDFLDCQTLLFDMMRGFATQTVRIEVPWKDIVGDLPNNPGDPDALYGQVLEESVNQLLARPSWGDFAQVVDRALDMGLDVIPLIAQGHTSPGGICPTIDGRTIAPDTSPRSDGDIQYVNADTYLYYLKLFAHATVRRYKDKVSIWMIEGELNAARLNQRLGWWRNGNLWADDSPGGFQDKVWAILRDAVRQEDPTAKVTTSFHMLNIVKGLERFAGDVDIVGVNIYPNYKFAYPVMGFAVGEMVWATRRALIGLGKGEKEIHVTETSYPAKVRDNSDTPPADLAVDQNMSYFSDARQRQFMNDAIATSLACGAKGFLWFGFLDTDAPSGQEPFTNYGSLIPKDVVPFASYNFKPAASQTFYPRALSAHPGKVKVELANKDLNSGSDLGGRLCLVRERDNVASGSIVFAIKGQDHTSQTHSQYLQGKKHQLWNQTASEFHLKEGFHPDMSSESVPRVARFAPTSSVTITSNVGTIVSTGFEIRDPWYVEPQASGSAGEQIDQFHTINQAMYEVFLNQGYRIDQLVAPYYCIRAPSKAVDNLGNTWAFSNWGEVTNTEIAPVAGRPYEADVIFRAANASVEAIYKPLYQIRVKPNISLRPVSVDDTTITSETVFEWLQDTQHTLSVQTPQDGSDVRYIFAGWSFADSSGQTVASQNQLTLAVSRPLEVTANFVAACSAPTLASPSNGATNQPTALILSWNNSAGAVSYTVRWASSAGRDSATVYLASSYAVPGLAGQTTYSWSVTANSTEGSLTSETWQFTTVAGPPLAPSLSFPYDNSVNVPTSVTLSWYPSAGATSYSYQLASNPAFTGSNGSPPTESTSQTIRGLEYGQTYYWRVTAVNSLGSAQSGTRSFRVKYATSSSPLAPGDGSINVSISPQIYWVTRDGETYRAQVSTDPSFTQVIYDIRNTSAGSAAVSLSYSTKYYWRIHEEGASSGEDWSEVWSFTTAPEAPSTPIPLSPSNGAQNVPTTLTWQWSQVPRAVNYSLQVSTDSTFSTLSFPEVSADNWFSSTLLYHWFGVTELPGATKFYWRVNAKNPGGTSAWSQPWTFTTAAVPPRSAPTLLSPANWWPEDVPLTTTLKWSVVSGATSYTVQWSDNSSFATADSSVTTSLEFTVSGLSKSTRYYWRVYASNSAGRSAWSEYWSFVTIPNPPSAPNLVEPLNGQTNVSVPLILYWEAGSFRSGDRMLSYRVQVSKDTSFSVNVLDDSTRTSASRGLDSLEYFVTYYWRVNMKNGWGTGDWSQRWSFTTGPPPPPPLPGLLSPQNEQNNMVADSTVLSWTPRAGATSYSVQWDVSSEFGGNNIATTTSSTFVPPGLANSTTYWWRVSSYNAGGTRGWSYAWSFVTQPAPPVLTGPANGSTGVLTEYSLFWMPTSGSNTHRVQMATDSVFSTLVFDVENVVYDSYSFSGLSRNTKYYWRAKTTTAEGTSKWSPGWSFITQPPPPAAPEKVSPPNMSTEVPVLNLSLVWKRSPNATTYGFEVVTDSNFFSYWPRIAGYNGIVDTTVTITGLDINTVYYWRVKAGGAWSQPWRFTTTTLPPPSAPTLLSPAIDPNMNTPLTVTLKWSAVSGATSYTVQWSTNAYFGAADSSVTTSPEFTLSGLSRSTWYFWRVRASNSTGNSAWCDNWDFLTIPNPPSAPNLLEPGNGQTSVSLTPTLKWEKDDLILSYRVQVSKDTLFSVNVLDDSTVTPSSNYQFAYRDLKSLEYLTTYYWRVNRKNAGGSGEWSQRWSFTTVPPPPPAGPSLLSPQYGQNSMSVDSTVLSWSAPAGATSYSLQWDVDPGFGSNNVVTTSSTTFILRGLTNSTTYWWRVSSFSASGTRGWGSAWPFVTQPPPPRLARPENKSTGVPTTETLYWTSESGNSHGAQIATDSAFAALVLNLENLPYSSCSFSGLSTNTKYYWRAKVTTEIGTSTWSPAWSFVTQPPPPAAPNRVSPLNLSRGVPTMNPLLVWNKPPNGYSYGYEVAKDSNFLSSSPRVATSSGIRDTTVGIGGLEFNMVYYWRVNARNQYGVLGAWSQPWRFTTMGPPLSAPTPISPANSSSDALLTTTLKWGAVSGATSYTVQWSGNSSFVTADSSVTTSPEFTVSGLSKSTLYYWRVRASNFSCESDWSTIWSFITILPQPVVISQLYGGGGNWAENSEYKDDFVELFNRTEAPVNLGGWSIQSASAADSTWSTVPLSGSIGAGKYYLIKLVSGCWTPVELPPPDATGTVDLHPNQGKVALVSNTVPLRVSSPRGNSSVIDFVGYGNGTNAYEGSRAAPIPDYNHSIKRLSEGNTDTNNNGQDFIVDHPTPRNGRPSMTRSGRTFANDPTIGSVEWPSPYLVQTSDDAYAIVVLNLSASNYLKVTNFGFDIPSGASITGLLVEIEKKMDGGAGIRDFSIKMIKAGSIAGNDKAFGSSIWPCRADIYSTYGGATDLWGLSWTPEEINASGFGVVFSAKEPDGISVRTKIDYIQMTVYYSLPPSADQGDISAKPNQPGKQELDESQGPDIALPTSYTLHHNYPNPFNSETEITYGLPKESHVRLTVYDLLGREVRTLVDGTRSPGFHRVRWDGRDQSGNAVSSSLYIYKLDHPDGVIAKGMLLLK